MFYETFFSCHVLKISSVIHSFLPLSNRLDEPEHNQKNDCIVIGNCLITAWNARQAL